MGGGGLAGGGAHPLPFFWPHHQLIWIPIPCPTFPFHQQCPRQTATMIADWGSDLREISNGHGTRRIHPLTEHPVGAPFQLSPPRSKIRSAEARNTMDLLEVDWLDLGFLEIPDINFLR